MVAASFSTLSGLYWPTCRFLQIPCGALRYGAVFQGHRFSGVWPAKQVSQSIEYKDLFPIVVAAYLWGPPMSLQTGQLPIR